jgi:hypothetical protein
MCDCFVIVSLYDVQECHSDHEWYTHQGHQVITDF